MTPYWNGFVSELFKLASRDYKTFETVEEAKKVLKKGDIIVTQPMHPEDMPLLHKVLRTGLVHYQGTPWTHSGLYDGEGGVIESGGKAAFKEHKTNGVAKIPLKKFMEYYQVRVLRPKATKKDKEDAVAYAKSRIGASFNLSGMLSNALPTSSRENPRGKRLRQDVMDLHCSQLVANAYPNLPFARSKHLHHVKPVDIQKSPLTKIVGESIKPE